MISTKNENISKAIKKNWDENYVELINKRNLHQEETSEKISEGVKKHYLMHNEHKTAISNAQIKKWSRIKVALDYCKKNGVCLE